MQNYMFLWWPGKSHYSLARKFWFICHIHHTLHLQISIYLDLYKILLMEKISIPWKTVKGTWNCSLLKKIKSCRKMELWSCLKNGRRQWNKRVNTLFNKVLGENEKCVFYLKTEGSFWPTQYIPINNPLKCQWTGEELQDGGRLRHGDHLPPHKYIRNTSTCGTTPTEHLLKTGRRTQTSQKAGNSPHTWVGQKKKEKTETKE